jgi:hypothetical protein
LLRNIIYELKDWWIVTTSVWIDDDWHFVWKGFLRISEVEYKQGIEKNRFSKYTINKVLEIEKLKNTNI